MSVANTVLNTLREHHIDFGLVPHPKAFTSAKIAARAINKIIDRSIKVKIVNRYWLKVKCSINN